MIALRAAERALNKHRTERALRERSGSLQFARDPFDFGRVGFDRRLKYFTAAAYSSISNAFLSWIKSSVARARSRFFGRERVTLKLE